MIDSVSDHFVNFLAFVSLAAVLCVYSILCMRFAWMVCPRNYLLLACHASNESVQLYQLSRWLKHQRYVSQYHECIIIHSNFKQKHTIWTILEMFHKFWYLNYESFMIVVTWKFCSQIKRLSKAFERLSCRSIWINFPFLLLINFCLVSVKNKIWFSYCVFLRYLCQKEDKVSSWLPSFHHPTIRHPKQKKNKKMYLTTKATCIFIVNLHICKVPNCLFFP